MSASAFSGRDRPSAPAAHKDSGPSEPAAQGWIGVDVTRFGPTRPTRALLPLLVMALIVALGIASLRIDLIRTRYALAAATAEEKQLIADQHALIVRKRKLVDPAGLAVLARERGFVPAEAIRTVVDPMPGIVVTPPGLSRVVLPQVAAAPPSDSAADHRPWSSQP